MIGQIAVWWLASSCIGAAAAPIVWRVFPRLPDRGFGLSRALGLLLSGYLVWIGASLGWLRNGSAGALMSVLAVAAVGLFLVRSDWRGWLAWLRGNLRTVATIEAVFLVAFVAWAIVRAFNPEIVATEKPMELAFLNAILRSPTFPPHDPWLSGFAISYYYLGYVLLSVPTWLTGVAAGEAFNLGSALWFALVVVGSYSLVYNLLGLRQRVQRRLAALLGPLFVVITGNLGGILEVMHSLQWFWRRLADGTMVSPFWAWLNLEDLVQPPGNLPVFPPSRFWFWWQASRVVNDIDLAGRHVEVIDEFPFFSFLLADNHPHVLALPFAILAVAVALHVFTGQRQEGFRLKILQLSPKVERRALLWVTAIGAAAVVVRSAGGIAQAAPVEWSLGLLRGLAIVAGGAGALWIVAGFLSGREASALAPGELLIAGWLAGSLAFLNTWDLPIYLALILGAAAWGTREAGARAAGRRLGIALVMVALIAGLTVMAWIPTFSSQAGGVLPNLVFPTRLPHFLIMFAVPLAPVLFWMAQFVADLVPRHWRRILAIGLAVPLILLAGSLLLAGVIATASPEAVAPALAGMGATGSAELMAEALARRLGSSWVAILASIVIATGWIALSRTSRIPAEQADRSGAEPFVILMLGLGAALVIVPEFFYLKDAFGTRMNTVFKFYYAAWLLWGLTAAYAVASPVSLRSRGSRVVYVVSVIPLLLGLVYTTTALWEKTNRFQPPFAPTLDGTAHLDRSDPSDAVAIRWIRERLPMGVMAEAAGGSYTTFGRISAHTGFPAILGWDFHEFQWRGDYAPQGSRAADLERLYQTRDWEEARAVLDRYAIRYVYLGALERNRYSPVVTRKFDVYMDLLYQSEEVTIYGRRVEETP